LQQDPTSLLQFTENPLVLTNHISSLLHQNSHEKYINHLFCGLFGCKTSGYRYL
jgi:hypothetical protein